MNIKDQLRILLRDAKDFDDLFNGIYELIGDEE